MYDDDQGSPADWYNPTLPPSFEPTFLQTASAVSNEPTGGMDEMGLEDLRFDMDFSEWAAEFDFNFGAPINEEPASSEAQSASMVVNDTELITSEVDDNNASKPQTTPHDSVELLNDQSSAVDSPKSPGHRDAPEEWASLLTFDEDESNAYQDFYTPPGGPDDESSALAYGLLHYEQGISTVYPEEVTPESATKPYHTHGGLARVADREWVVSSTSTLSSAPATPTIFNQGSQGALQARKLDNNPVGCSNSYPTGQGMNRMHHAQMHNTTFGTQGLEPNVFGGDEGSLTRYPPIENGFGGPGPYWQSQEPVVSAGPVGFSTPATSSGAVNQSAAVGPGDADFIPLFFTEQEFENRKAAREAARVTSDYPWNDIPAQHEILRRLYNAIRNTDGVADSNKVASKFADHSKIPDLAVHETCWEVMIHCRDSQELKGLLVGEHYNTKYNVKETFTERIESVIAALHASKAICKSAMDPSFLDRLADQPEDELKQKSSNKRLNQVKTAQNKAGQKAISLRHADKDGAWKGPPVDVDDDESEAEPVAESSRAKRKRETGDAAAATSRKRRRRSPGSPSNMA